MNPSAVPVLLPVLIVLACGLLWLVVTAAFLLWGARLAGIHTRSWSRAITTVLLGGIASSLLTVFLSAAPIAGTGAGVLLGFCVSAIVMMALFDTTFGKALAANLLAWVLSIAMGVAVVFVGFAVAGLLVALST